MITHIAHIQLHTLTMKHVRLVYHERLGFPIIREEERLIEFEITPFTSLRFALWQQPMYQAHIAFQIPRSCFDESVERVKHAGLLVTEDDVAWGDGNSIYFRDADGHSLELICHDYVAENVLTPNHHLNVIYIREADIIVPQVDAFRRWLVNNLEMRSHSDKEDDEFDFVCGGTAQLPISALDRINIFGGVGVRRHYTLVFGMPDREFMDRVNARLEANGELTEMQVNELRFEHEGVKMGLRFTPEFDPGIPKQLILPLAT